MEKGKMRLKKQLYPDMNDTESILWKYDKEKNPLKPAEEDVEKIYNLIKQLINDDDRKFDDDTKDIDIKNILKLVYKDLSKEEKEELQYRKINENKRLSEIKIDVVKGSIYKIKKYFLENNYLKDIRGGSMMIDYLNIDAVEKVMINGKYRFNGDNIIYCGGGNIFLVVPAGYGQGLCETFETEFTKMGLTVMNAFETISCSLYDLLFDFSKIKKKIESKVTERSKIKFYEIDPDLQSYMWNAVLEGIEKNNREKNLKQNIVYKKEEKGIGVCDLCDIREAKYTIKNEPDIHKVCCSCMRKHLMGKQKSKFLDDYEQHVREKKDVSFKIDDSSRVGSLDDISDEIAVIYGDGNNMGNVLNSVYNIFEMMYFSRKTDNGAKNAVYGALYNAMGKSAKFEIVALGGDDIFIIVPAEHAFKIASDIINIFDEKFDHTITMSVGIAIAKNATPIASLFELAQEKLHEAKKFLKEKEEDKKIEEGSMDVIELIGDMHFRGSKDEKRIFPLSNSNYKAYSKKIEQFKKSNKARTQLYKIGYAKENMSPEEFELFYYYQNSKQKGPNVDELIKNIIEGSKERGDEIYIKDPITINRGNPYDINWKELILIYERGVE